MEIKGLLTEKRNQHTMNIDQVSTIEILRIMNKEDQTVPQIILDSLPEIGIAVDKIAEAFKHDGRLIYMGAGTSGRMGILDASECPPTFGTPPEQVIGLIAGGSTAIKDAVEGAEDDPSLAVKDLQEINISSKDIVVGIAASGRTPYSLSGIEYANQKGAFTISLTCSPDSVMEKAAELAITIKTGPEVVTGSTRLKAGTAQKLVLNMLTTASMIKIGKVYSNLMVDVAASNEKLIERSKWIVAEATGVDPDAAEIALQRFQSVKGAIIHLLTGLEEDDIHMKMQEHKGHVRDIIESVSLNKA